MKISTNRKTKFTVSRLAKEAGVGITTVRYYQKRGLVQMPDRPAFGGFRTYGQAHLERLVQIKRAQELGFTLTEIRELLTCLELENCELVKSLIERKRRSIKARIRELVKVDNDLSAWSAKCSPDKRSGCPLLGELFRPLSP